MSVKVSKAKLLKALDELEAAAIEKGDPILDQDTEGGGEELPKQGEPLSAKAPSDVESDVDKAMSASDDSEADDSEADDSEADDSEADDSEKKVAKAEDEADDSEFDDDKVAEKSLSKRAAKNGAMAKAFEVSEFLQGLVSETSATIEGVRKSFDERIGGLDDRLSSMDAGRREFNGKLAKAMVTLGGVVEDLASAVARQEEMLAKVLNMPAPSQRRSVVSKSEVVDPPIGADLIPEGIAGLSPHIVGEWLVQKALAREIDGQIVTRFETSHGDFRVLPVHVQQAVERDLLRK